MYDPLRYELLRLEREARARDARTYVLRKPAPRPRPTSDRSASTSRLSPTAWLAGLVHIQRPLRAQRPTC